jgi:glycine cleavage system protein P-like pyridoxal-binding family
MKFRVLDIAKNLEDFPQYAKDTLEFPELVEEVEDETEIFIYCENNESFYRASEFFLAIDMKTFESNDAVIE